MSLWGQLALIVTICAVEVLVAAGRYVEPRICWPSTREPDSWAIGSICVPEPRKPFSSAGISRWKIGAGISSSSAVKHRAALLGPHTAAGFRGFVCQCVFLSKRSFFLATTHDHSKPRRVENNKGNAAKQVCSDTAEVIQHVKVSLCALCVKCALTDAKLPFQRFFFSSSSFQSPSPLLQQQKYFFKKREKISLVTRFVFLRFSREHTHKC